MDNDGLPHCEVRASDSNASCSADPSDSGRPESSSSLSSSRHGMELLLSPTANMRPSAADRASNKRHVSDEENKESKSRLAMNKRWYCNECKINKHNTN